PPLFLSPPHRDPPRSKIPPLFLCLSNPAPPPDPHGSFFLVGTRSSQPQRLPSFSTLSPTDGRGASVPSSLAGAVPPTFPSLLCSHGARGPPSPCIFLVAAEEDPAAVDALRRLVSVLTSAAASD
uniref:Uncharacterized protein n=1 Tax=Triticum urartu TaxID=4572 RepID=A0A8R7Q9D0_TRIUA